jgi:hypothetical protein
MSEIQDTLKERGNRYGSYRSVAWTSQSLKAVVLQSYNVKNNSLEWYQHESLDLICNKIARILNGDPNYRDSWLDIAGYAQLVVDELDKNVNI